jgi:hypothetical protein
MNSSSGASFAEEVHNASTNSEVVSAVQRAVEAPWVFFYGGLLDALQAYIRTQHARADDDDVANWTSVVELLTFKTIADVDACAVGVKTLVAAHPVITAKLRVLSLLTLCGQQSMSISGIYLSYDTVARAVGVRGSIEVQRVVLSAVLHRLCVARLNEEALKVRVCSYESRNVTATEVEALRDRMKEWTKFTEGQLRDMQ